MPAAEPVLVVDDSALMRDTICATLAPRGYHVNVAGDGREALQYLRDADEPQIVILDIVMPLLDGLGLCREIEHDAQLKNAGHKIVLMSSTVRLSALDIPATAGQLAKPFTRQQLLAAVDAARRGA